MDYATFWLFAFGGLCTVYLALAGLDYGVGIVAPFVARSDGERRLVLNALGPFLLCNEVWLLTAIGMLIGTLPGLGSRLLMGTFPMPIVAFAGAIMLNVGVQLRSRHSAERVRRGWDVLICVGGGLAAFGWAATLTSLLAGVPLDAAGDVVGPLGAVNAFTVFGGLCGVGLMAAHGAVFLGARTSGPPASRARRVAAALVVAANLLAVGTILVGIFEGDIEGAVRNPVLALALLLVALAAALVGPWLMSRGLHWTAVVATAGAVALYPVLIFAGKYPTLVTSSRPGGPGLTADRLAASHGALVAITWTAGPVLVLVIAVQAYAWWAFRGRLTVRSPIFY